MKLPNLDKILISKKKLINYIFSETHSSGKFKAKFFSKFGFNENNTDLFKKALRKLARSEEVKQIVPSLYGTKYIIEGKIKTPKGEIINIRTVWIVESAQGSPRFVTAYPI